MMKKLLIMFFLGIGIAGVAYAAPGVNIFKNIQPETNTTYDLGSSTPAKLWNNVFTNNLLVNSQAGTGGCAYFDASGYLIGGAACSGGGGGGSGGGFSTSSPNIIYTNFLTSTNALVGINTSTPRAILAVKGISGTTTPVLLVTSSTNATLLRVDGNGTTTIPSLGTGPVYSSTGALYTNGTTGTGLTVQATSPTLVTPILGVASGTALTLSNNLWVSGTLNITGSSTLATTSIPALSNLTSNGFVKTSGGIGLLSVDTATYLTGNQTITLSGDVSGSGTTGITTTIGNDKVTEAMLKVVDTPTDEDILTYESTTGDFEWHTPAQLSLPTYTYASSSYVHLWNLQAGSNITITTSSVPTIAVSSTPTFTTLSTGQGQYELYAMNQDVLTSSNVTFNTLTVTATTTLSAATTTINGVNYYWPSAQSVGTKILQNDGTGQLSWVADQTGGGGSLSGGTVGFAAIWASSTAVTIGTLRDNGTVSGVNATSSTVSFNIQGTTTLNPFNVSSSTGDSILKVGVNSRVGINSSTPNATLVVQGLSTSPTTDILRVASSSGVSQFTVASNGSTTLSSLGTGLVRSSSGSLYTDTSTYLTSALTSLSALTGPAVHVATTSDTNILISISTTTANTLTFIPSFTGTLAASRLNSNVVQGVTNDTNVTGSIATQALTLGWTGSLATARGGTGTTTWQTGAIPFYNGSNFTENISKLFWDNTNSRLGVGSGTPTATLSVQGTAGSADIFRVASSTLTTVFSIKANGSTTLSSLGTGCVGVSSGSLYTTPCGGAGTIDGSGAPGLVTTWSDADTLTTGLFRDNGTVAGINATSSTVLFNVQGTSGSTNNIFNISSSTGISILTATSNQRVGVGSSTPIGTFVVQGTSTYPTVKPFIIASSSGSELITVTPTGRLGIGSSTPLGALSVVGDFYQNGSYARFGSAMPIGACGGQSCLEIWGDDNTTAGVTLLVGNRNSGTSAYTQMLLLNDISGNVANFAGLFLNSSTYTDSTFGNAVNKTNQLLLQNTMGPVTITSATTTSGEYINFLVGSNNVDGEAMRITDSRRVGIGTSSPVATLTVRGTSTAPTIYPFVVASSSGASLFVVTNAGKVGIGTNTPSSFFTAVDSVASSSLILIGGPGSPPERGCIGQYDYGQSAYVYSWFHNGTYATSTSLPSDCSQ